VPCRATSASIEARASPLGHGSGCPDHMSDTSEVPELADPLCATRKSEKWAKIRHSRHAKVQSPDTFRQPLGLVFLPELNPRSRGESSQKGSRLAPAIPKGHIACTDHQAVSALVSKKETRFGVALATDGGNRASRSEHPDWYMDEVHRMLTGRSPTSGASPTS
jgi:hypothetical protein